MTKNTLKILFPFLCLLLSLLFPKACMEGVEKGLDLALYSAFPALFPALVLSGVLSRIIGAKSKKSALLTPFFLGLVCGFPIGAKTVCSLLKERKVSPKKASLLLPFISGASPSFLISFCGITLFSDAKKGLVLYLLQSAFFLISFLIFFGKDLFKKEEKSLSSKDSPPFKFIIPKALSEGMSAFLYISSCIVFFSFLSSLCLSLFSLSPVLQSLLSLFLELTGGVKSLVFLPKNLIFPLCALGVGWNGFSVHLQTLGLISEEGISPKPYLFGKAVFALLFFLSALFLQKLL